MVKIYAYGARAPVGGADIVQQQFRLSHVYQQTLTRIEREKSIAIEALRYAATSAETDAYAAAWVAVAEAAGQLHNLRSTKGDVLEPDNEMAAEKREEVKLAKSALTAAREVMTKAQETFYAARRRVSPLIKPAIRSFVEQSSAEKKIVYAAIVDRDACNIGAAVANFFAWVRGWAPLYRDAFMYPPLWYTIGKVSESVDRAAEAASKEGFEAVVEEEVARLRPILPKMPKYDGSGKIVVQLKGDWLTAAECVEKKRVPEGKSRLMVKRGGKECSVERDGDHLFVLSRWGERTEETVEGSPVEQWLVFRRANELATDTRLRIDVVGRGASLERQGRSLGTSRLGKIVRNGPRKGQERIFPEARKADGARGDLDHAIVKLRVGTNSERAPVWAEWPVSIARPIPANADVKWAEIHAMKIGQRTEWRLLVTVNEPDTRAKSGDSTLGVNLGWRNLPNDEGVRVAYAVGSDGFKEEVLVPANCARAIAHVAGLEGTRKDNFNLAVKVLDRWIEPPDGDRHYDWPEALLFAARNRDRWLSPKKLVRFLFTWRENRFPGDDAIFEILSAWRKQDKHLWFWTADEREKTLRMRQDFYRMVAARWAKRYDHVVVTDMDLRDFAELPAPEEGAKTSGKVQRVTQRLAAPSVLWAAVENACSTNGTAFSEVTRTEEKNGRKQSRSPLLTHVCNECGAVTKFDAKAQLRHTCLECHAEWDQDENHCKNLLASAEVMRKRAEALAPTENSAPAGGKNGDGGRFKRKRSKARTQTAENTTSSGMGGSEPCAGG